MSLLIWIIITFTLIYNKMEHFYEGMEEIFCNDNDSRHSNTFILTSQILISAIILSQSIQTFWYPQRQLQNWGNFGQFWNGISIPSIDNTAVTYNFAPECIITIMIFVSLTAFLTLLVITIKYFKWKTPHMIIPITRNLLRLICDVYFISSAKILFAVIKYSSSQYTIVQEYSTSNTSMFDYGTSGLISCVFLLLILIFLTTIYNATSCDIRQPLDNKLSIAKSRTIVNQLRSIVYFLNLFMYFFLGYSYYQIYIFAILILYGILTGYYAYYLPFYCEILNYVKIFFHLDCFFIILAFWIGYLLNDSGVPFLLTLIMQVVLLIISYFILKYRISKISKDIQAFYKQFEVFELSIRQVLKSGELEERIITQMNKNFYLYRDKLNIVMQTYYCSDILLNDTLAYNKIIGLNIKGIDIFTNFQIYKCRKNITSKCKISPAEGIQLYQYFTDLEKLKLDDISFCEKYSKFLQTIVEPNPNLSKLKNFIDELINQQNLLTNSYQEILTTFPNSNEANEMYGSFLTYILYDLEKGKLYLNKIIQSGNDVGPSKGNYTKVNDRGFITFSGHAKNSGKIIYANKSFISYLGIPAELAKTFFFSDFLPKSYSKDHDLLLKNFIKNYTESIVYKTLPLFLVNYNGYLCEYFITLECIGDKDSINFLCSIDPIHCGQRELAVIDLNGFIYSHSKDFLKMLGYEYKTGENMNIQYYIPDLFINELIIDTVYEIKQKMPSNCERTSKTIGTILKSCKINEIIIYILFITDDMNQLTSWKIGTNFYDIDGKNFQYFVSEDKELEEEKKIEEKDIKEVSKHLLQLPDENHLRTNKRKIRRYSIRSKTEDTHSSSDNVLDRKELNAAEKSKTVLKVTRILLFLSVYYI